MSLLVGSAWAQDDASEDEEEEIFELSPFTVEASDSDGYRATHTLAGTRIKTELRDVGAAISVVTEQFMQDIGAKDNETLLSYTLNTEVGGGRGTYGGFGSGAYLDENSTFANPNQNTRVRGLTSADNTRNYFITDIPWDGYVVERVDMVRGPNAVLFGLGSPAGVINAGIAEANFVNSGNAEINFGSWGSTRMSLKLNRVLLEDELAVKIAMLKDDEKFRQKPAYDSDERIFVAAKYAPKFLQSESSSLTLQGHVEAGRIKSNRPRWLPPVDNITPFFNPSRDEEGNFNPLGGMDRTLVHPWLAGDVEGEYDLGIPHLGRAAENRRIRDENGDPVQDGNGNDLYEPNPYWTPIIANFGNVYGHPVMVFGDGNSSGVNRVFQMSVDSQYSINADGEVGDNSGLAYPFNTLRGVNSYDGYARTVELPFYETGAYKAKSLADTSVFDFKNHLIDGPNKREDSDFDTLYLSLSHTFMDGRFGYDLSYFNQNRHQFSSSSVGGSLKLDVNSHLQDLSVNPNAGRPYVESVYDWGSSFGDQKRDAARVTAFARHDFQSSGQDGWLPRLLGRHTVTGLWSKENQETDFRSFVPYVLDGAYRDYSNPHGYGSNTPSLRTVHYLGDRIDMRESAAGANIPGLKAVQAPPSQANVYAFDSHWDYSKGIDPAAPWTNPWNGDVSTQSFNPENHVGWVNMPMDIVDAIGSGNVDDYTTSGKIARSEIESEALIWQGHFWDGAVVGMYGWRKDSPLQAGLDADKLAYARGGNTFSDDSFVNLTPETINYGVPRSDGTYENSYGYVLPSLEGEPGETQTASLAVHLNPLLGDWLPLNVSLYYNTSENFQPLAGRVDFFGNEIPSPTGNTEDYSVLIATKDNKYSLKVTQYQTELQNANLTAGIQAWKITYMTNLGTEYAKRAYYNLSGNVWDEQYTQPTDPNKPWWERGGYDYYSPFVNGVDQGPAVEEAAIADWFEMLKHLPEGYAEAWSLRNYELALTQPSATPPNGLAYTEDSISKGTEFEFTAQPSEQLRLAFNARKSEASRTNVGGDALNEWVAFLDEWLLPEEDANGNRIYNAGDVRRYWLADSSSSIRDDYLSFRYDYVLTKLLEGQSNPEFAKWNFNLVATYQFKDGFLGGFYAGGGYRWTDKKVIGYSLKYLDADGQEVAIADLSDYKANNGGKLPNAVTDLENPYYADAEDAVDVWFGRSVKLNDKVDWRIQVNVRDLFQDGELIPLTVQPDGSPGASRIPGSTEWTVSNSFSF